MKMSWLKDCLGTEKAVIAMCHLQAMPGDPQYDKKRGMQYVIDCAYKDMTALQNGGVDAIMFSNEFSLPYLTKVRTETTASMARVIGELRAEIKIPFGVNCLWDPYASLDLAAATNAVFIREIMSGVYGSDFGLWNTNTGDLVRHQYSIGAENVKKIFNIVPEGAKYLSSRSIEEIAKSTNFNCKPDAIAVSGLTAGSATNTDTLSKVKEVVPDTVVLANTGCKDTTIEDILKIADGAVVGTFFKEDGKFENMVAQSRVERFMEVVHRVR